MRIFSKIRGQGRPLIFLHGFPMHQGIWDTFSDHFISSYTTVTLDLPGFGKSDLLPEGFTLDDVASEVLSFLETHKLRNAVVIGHSLGGYVALAMVAKRPEMIDGLVLFHSTALADSADRKESRNKVIDFVNRNGAKEFTTNFIAPLFADPQHADIERIKQIAATTVKGTVVGYAKAMRDRPDRTKTIRTYEKPTLFLAGAKDSGIPVASIYEQAEGCKTCEIHVMEGVAHMGMVENPVGAAERIKDFLKKI
ncbi:alpha/beta hydrolase [Chryseolinea sp. T2]|uniref:alpha/beta fold hydrolase n=1 Tax=Chryseolinea sp. T2 TaxID=3129255 RepID=UPI003077BEBE